jgi:hypothetical protein
MASARAVIRSLSHLRPYVATYTAPTTLTKTTTPFFYRPSSSTIGGTGSGGRKSSNGSGSRVGSSPLHTDDTHIGVDISTPLDPTPPLPVDHHPIPSPPLPTPTTDIPSPSPSPSPLPDSTISSSPKVMEWPDLPAGATPPRGGHQLYAAVEKPQRTGRFMLPYIRHLFSLLLMMVVGLTGKYINRLGR